MSRLDELRHVAGLIGIQTRHVDALGAWHEPSEDTLAALIGALGLPADPNQAADRLAGENAAAPFGLSPVQIVAQDAADFAVSLRLPNGSDSVEWRCRFEDGTEASGRSDGSALRLPAPLPLGYHRLALQAGDETAEIELIVAPPSCHLPEALHPGRRNWGLTTQLYGLRSARDWGIGDFTDLGWLARAAGRLGAATVGINPLHALFAAAF
jgi:MalQ N-terminal beta sandwich domain